MTERTDPGRDELQNRLVGPIDGALHLLDRQLLDREGRMLGKVDDVELSDTGTGTAAGLIITGVLTGPAALARRLGGRLGGGLAAKWGQLRVSEPDRTRPWRIDWSDVDRLDSALHLAVTRDGVLRRDRDERRLGSLTGMEVVTDGPGPTPTRGRGRVLDARFAPGLDGRMQLTSLLVGRGRPGGLLGYDRRSDQGPWLVRVAVRRLHRHTVIADAEQARVDWDAGVVTLAAAPTDPPGHPFD
jgi:sporulation protein YlmC with PRC-barrel domain